MPKSRNSARQEVIFQLFEACYDSEGAVKVEFKKVFKYTF